MWNKIVKKIEKLAKMMNIPNCDSDSCDRGDNEGNNEEYNIKIDAGLKKEIEKLIKDNEKYFVSEITARTQNVILHKGPDYIEDLKMSGYYFNIAAETFEKYGIFFYIYDLYECTYAPEQVKRELGRLVHKYGIEKVTEEIALYMKENYSDKFGISIICRK